ncbi:MAG TPA: DUF2066 domain-containing protein [Rhizomicrobium sp.]|jgi:hypothetical protein
MRSLLNLFVATAACFLIAAAPPSKNPPAKPAKPVGQHEQAAKPAPVKGDPYSVTVPVDASGPSSSVARTEAINAGQAKAWEDLSHRLLPQKDWPKLPKLDEPGVQRLIRGYTVSNEKRSTTRYIARVTYIFNPGAVRHLLRVSDIGVAEQGGTAILVVAMSPTYGAHQPWALAWTQLKSAGAQVPLVTPIGDEVDQSDLGQLRFSDATWAAVAPVASRVHAGEAVLVQATNPAASQMTVHIRRIGPGKNFPVPDVTIPIPSRTPPQKAYALAAEQTAAAIEDAWKLRTSIDFGRKSRLTADARIASLEQWTDLVSRLSAMPLVSDVTVQAMNTGEGRLIISYSGTPDQLRDAAAQSDVSLDSRDGVWWVSASRSAASRTDDQ